MLVCLSVWCCALTPSGSSRLRSQGDECFSCVAAEQWQRASSACQLDNKHRPLDYRRHWALHQLLRSLTRVRTVVLVKTRALLHHSFVVPVLAGLFVAFASFHCFFFISFFLFQIWLARLLSAQLQWSAFVHQHHLGSSSGRSEVCYRPRGHCHLRSGQRLCWSCRLRTHGTCLLLDVVKEHVIALSCLGIAFYSVVQVLAPVRNCSLAILPF